MYDRVNKWGGAERVLLALHEIWPEAPLFTAVYDPRGAPWARVFQVHTSFMQHLPFAKSHHELYPWLTPMAFETFDFSGFDVVITVTSAEAKSIITKPGTLHICYCLTPTRYLWSGRQDYQDNPGMGLLSAPARILMNTVSTLLKRWDLSAAWRPDSYIAVSHHVAERIKKYYRREVEAIIYPPVDMNKVKSSREAGSRSARQKSKVKSEGQNNYFLVVSRLVSYKRVDLIIDAFNELGWPLVVIGDGWQKRELMHKAKNNIKFVSSNLTDHELVGYYGNCRAFIHAADEDFGLAAAEAQGCGRPVISFRNSGVAEIVQEGKTGLFFARQTKEDIIHALTNFGKQAFSEADCRTNALRFSKTEFKRSFLRIVELLLNNYQNT